MEFNEFLKLVNKRKRTAFTIIFVTVVLTITISLLSPLKYGSKSRLLVLQNSTGSDVYSLSKSNEYLGNLFAQIVYSGSFYDQVKASQYNIDSNYFSGNYGQQLKKWQQTVKTDTQGDTGIIKINVYHPNIQEAKQISLAINDILINKNQDYHGGQNIKVNIIDQPLVSNYPIKPNLPYNIALALAASFIVSLFYIYIFPETSKKTIRLKPENSNREGHYVAQNQGYNAYNTPHNTVGNNGVNIPIREIINEIQEEYKPIIHGNIGNVLRK
ncbi:MAG: hypothetical protein WCT50_03210 [Patescibacteria group bacterium]